MRDARGDACVECVRRMRRKREISAQNVTHASDCDAGASYRVSVTHASRFGRSESNGEVLLRMKDVPVSSSPGSSGLPGRLRDDGYDLPADLSFDRWCSIMETLQRIERASRWWVGDAILYGEAAYGEDASQAFPDAFSGSPYAESTLRAAAWVSAAFPRETRVDGVTWTHHRVVADLPTIEAVALLREAAAVNTATGDEYVSTRDLLSKAKARKDALRGRAVTPEGEPIETAELVWHATEDDLTEDARRAMTAYAPQGRFRTAWIAGYLRALQWTGDESNFQPGRWQP